MTTTVTIRYNHTTFDAELIFFDSYEQHLKIRVTSAQSRLIPDGDEILDVLLPSNRWRKAQVQRWSSLAPLDFALTLVAD
jgi:hypothetical protein